mgnify:CR=1 FL=1
MATVPSISIIVAVYNAEKYLKRCIDSLLAQTFTDFEVLLINDGSTDNSGVMCDEYARNDSRFKAFHRTNHGVGSTRYFGMKQAQGTYTLHVDPDDWLENNTLEALYDTACKQQADMVIYDFMEEYPHKSVRSKQQPTGCDTFQVLCDVLSSKLQGGCCNKLIRRSCYERYNINFIEGLNWGEDTITVVRLLQCPIQVTYCEGTVYHYDCHSNVNSYTRFVTPAILEQRERSVRVLMDIVKGEPCMSYVMSRLLTVAYLAIRIDAYPARGFHHRYGILKHHKIMKMVGHSLQEKLFVWIALNVGYSMARILMRVKLLYQKIIKGRR